MADSSVSELAKQFQKKYPNIPDIEKFIADCEAAHPNSPKLFLNCVMTKIREYLQTVINDAQRKLKEMEEIFKPKGPVGPER